MKKKRFIRLVLSCGIQRNEARKIATGIEISRTYKALFEYYSPMLESRRMVINFKSLKNSFLAGFEGPMIIGIDIASGADKTVTVNHPCGYIDYPGGYSILRMTKAEHAEIHKR